MASPELRNLLPADFAEARPLSAQAAAREFRGVTLGKVTLDQLGIRGIAHYRGDSEKIGVRALMGWSFYPQYNDADPETRFYERLIIAQATDGYAVQPYMRGRTPTLVEFTLPVPETEEGKLGVAADVCGLAALLFTHPEKAVQFMGAALLNSPE